PPSILSSIAYLPCTAWATGGSPRPEWRPQAGPQSGGKNRAGCTRPARHTLGRVLVRQGHGTAAAREPGAAADRHCAWRRDGAAGSSGTHGRVWGGRGLRHEGSDRSGEAPDRRARATWIAHLG